MNSFLLNRQLGSISPQALAVAQNFRLVRALHNVPKVKLVSGDSSGGVPSPSTADVRAHRAGVNSLAIDSFEGR